MFSICTSVIFVLYILKSTYCQRRIVNGTISVGEPKYLAYFVKSTQSKREYTGWVCGGSIVHPLYILTSAACLVDVKHVYAITGYNKYVKSEDIDNDECTKRIKKKVVARAYQKDYNLKSGFSKFEWNTRDISLAKVESPYDFRDPMYLKYCSYPPAMIRLNFNSNFEDSGTQAVTFGWGHKKYFRLAGDSSDYNEERVNYASTVVIDKEMCKGQLTGHVDIQRRVNLFLICTSGPGSLDERGEIIDGSNSFNGSQNCGKESKTDNLFFRRNGNDTYNIYSTNQLYSNVTDQVDYRRHGPCQNDHGGPLVTWVGGREYVIGVACGFQVNKNMECVGPYLYTSTYSNGEFLYCMLRYSRRSPLCDTPPIDKGFKIVEEDIEWDSNDIQSYPYGGQSYDYYLTDE